MTDHMFWQDVRASVEMDPSITYLNTGTAGLIPKAVHSAALEHRTRLHHNPTDYAWRAMWDSLWLSRSRLATHIGTLPDRLIFFQNISQAINTFCLSCNLPSGSEILLSDHEYGAMRWAWERAASKHGWKLVTFRLPIQAETPNEIIASVQQSLSPRTKLLFLSHVLYTTGLVLPIREICQLAREQNVLSFIDGAHAPGMLPLHLDLLGADFYAANLHKWFMSPVGAAFLYVSRGLENHLRPWQVSWGYHDDRSQEHQRNEFGSTPWIRQFEMEGTRDITPWLLVPLNCDFLESIGYQAIESRLLELSSLVRQRINGVLGLELVTPENNLLRGGLTAFRVPQHYDSQQLRYRLWSEYKIEINVVNQGDEQYLRVSTHIYNARSEIEHLSTAIEGELKPD
ncbi:MAG: aminotransferase class V-fold PLP-dependent enzyme [Pirellula sp.]